MISSVSNVNFRGDAAPVNAQDLINSPGKFTTQAPKTDAPADSFEKEGAPAEKKKSKAPAIIGTIVGLLAATYVGLSIAVGKKALTRAVAEDGKELGFMGHVKNFFVAIGESGEKLWNKIRGVKADDVDGKPKKDAPDVKKPEGEVKPEGEAKPKGEVKAEGEAAPKVEAKPEGEVKAEGEAAPKAEAKPEGEVKAEGEAAPKTEAKPEGEVKAEGEAAPKTEAKPEGEVKAEGENK